MAGDRDPDAPVGKPTRGTTQQEHHPRMSGTNGAPTRRSTRHRQRSPRTLKVLAGAVPVVLVGAGLALVAVNGGVNATLDASASTCADPTHVSVSTTREFLPVLRKVASGVEEAAGDRAGCPAFEVTASAPAAAVSQVTGGGSDAPDVWVPDSSLWVQRANAQLGGDSLSQPVTVAQSPLVVAVPQARAAHYAGAGVPSWAQLLGGTVPARMSDPGASTAGLIALTTVQSALGSSPEVQQEIGGAMIKLSRTAAKSTDDLFAAAASQGAGAPGFPASEQQVLRYDAGHRSAGLPVRHGRPAEAGCGQGRVGAAQRPHVRDRPAGRAGRRLPHRRRPGRPHADAGRHQPRRERAAPAVAEGLRRRVSYLERGHHRDADAGRHRRLGVDDRAVRRP